MNIQKNKDFSIEWTEYTDALGSPSLVEAEVRYRGCLIVRGQYNRSPGSSDRAAKASVLRQVNKLVSTPRVQKFLATFDRDRKPHETVLVTVAV